MYQNMQMKIEKKTKEVGMEEMEHVRPLGHH
jgi:hypothetical protein